MVERLEVLPIFPLNTVLFPLAQLQLHIFEDRYREMVHECVASDLGFGVVLDREEALGDSPDPYLVGTKVKIASVETYDDGKMDIRVVGGQRFRIRRLEDGEKPYLLGHVEVIDEAKPTTNAQIETLATRLTHSVKEYIQSEFQKCDVQVSGIDLPVDPVALSFTVANLLKIENLDKQHLLETTDTMDRMIGLLPVLEQHIEDSKVNPEYRATPEILSEFVTSN